MGKSAKTYTKYADPSTLMDFSRNYNSYTEHSDDADTELRHEDAAGYVELSRSKHNLAKKLTHLHI